MLAFESGPLAGQSVGIVVVLSCLSAIAVVVWLIGRIMVAIESRKTNAVAVKPVAAKSPASTAKPAPASASVAKSAEGELTPELIAVIAAAVDVALEGRSHRILSVNQAMSSAWSSSGRSEIYASHRLRK